MRAASMHVSVEWTVSSDQPSRKLREGRSCRENAAKSPFRRFLAGRAGRAPSGTTPANRCQSTGIAGAARRCHGQERNNGTPLPENSRNARFRPSQKLKQGGSVKTARPQFSVGEQAESAGQWVPRREPGNQVCFAFEVGATCASRSRNLPQVNCRLCQQTPTRPSGYRHLAVPPSPQSHPCSRHARTESSSSACHL